MKIEAKKRLLDALGAGQAIERFVVDKTFAEYDSNQLLRSAVERQLDIIGEALSRAEDIGPSLTEVIPNVRRIIGLRNRIIHGYDTVDSQIVWDIVRTELPALITQLNTLLRNE